MPKKAYNVDEVQSMPAVLEVERGEGGLASVAGGWEGSDELVHILETSPRTGPRRVEDCY